MAALLERMRQHGKLMEAAPLALILHPFGIRHDQPANPLRIIGALGTTISMLIAALGILWIAAGIPFAVPGPELWDERFGSVLAVIYLIFNEGYATTAGDHLIRTEMCEEAIHLGRMLVALRADEAEAQGLLALMLITHARRAARAGGLIPLDHQDRGLWDAVLAVLDSAMTLVAPPAHIRSRRQYRPCMRRRPAIGRLIGCRWCCCMPRCCVTNPRPLCV